MATKTVSFSSSLPLELRRKIYMLATPPRIVHVQEYPEDREEFEETLRTTPVQSKLDPTLAHFAFNWNRRIHRHSTQQTLESYGITGGKALHQPWEPSAATPEIPLHWLANHPKVAWELVREGYLYSKAPIPALLHTCAESRAELMSCGYQLAFRTRSNGGRTWFNFERDVLYIDVNSEDDGYLDLLSGGPWDIGQLHPEDLKRVRKLALNRSGHLLPIQNPNSRYAVDYTRLLSGRLSGVLRLFSGITELLLVEWSQDDLGCWSEFSAESCAKKSLSNSQNIDSTEEDTEDMSQELWRCVAVEEIDALLALIATQDKSRTELYSVGDSTELLKAHKLQNGDTAPYFKHQELRLEQWLLEERDATVSGSNDGSVVPWNIPRIKAVHILPSSMASFLLRERQSAWVEFCETKRRQREVMQVTEGSPPVDQDDEQTVAEANGGTSTGACCGQCEYSYYLEQYAESQKKWWAEEGSVPAPGYEIIY